MKFTAILFSGLTGLSLHGALGASLQRRTCGNPADAVPFLRAFKPATGDHLETTSTTEWENAIESEGYQALSSIGRIFTTQEAGTVPLYRLFAGVPQLHFYTPSAVERDQAAQEGYTEEGIAGYVYMDSTCGASPLYRLFSTITGDHMYSMDATEINTVVKTENYNFEGLQCFIFPL
ncbi:hypothetical protein MVEN_02155300 [Mycena venus]|uniref:DUF5648 domain-containing protein n=1 Tax=Mycena venus TaxID=2733690 RepID=A0A8H6X9L0_9AGAR|nr:hypothetical protein MVEN_02155300 [Mycena venus]